MENGMFMYPIGPCAAAIAAGAVGTATVQIGAEDFEAYAFNFNAYLSGAVAAMGVTGTPLRREPGAEATAPLPSLSQIMVQIDVGQGNKLTRDFVPLNLVSGTGERPNHLFRPLRIPRMSTVTFSFRNDSAQSVNLMGCLMGVNNPR